MGKATEEELYDVSSQTDKPSEEPPQEPPHEPPQRTKKNEVQFPSEGHKPPVFVNDTGDDLTSISNRLGDISLVTKGAQRFRQPDFFGFETPPGKHSANGSVGSFPNNTPNTSFNAGFDSPSRNSPGLHVPAGYIPDGSKEFPQPIYFHADGNGFRNGGLFISPSNETKGNQQYNTMSIESTCPADDVDLWTMRLARMDELPEDLRRYHLRAVIVGQPTLDFYNRHSGDHYANVNGEFDATTMARKAAETQINEDKDNDLAMSYSIILFPFSMEPLDNSVFSSHPQEVAVYRLTPVKTEATVSAFGKEMYACTVTWAIALSGKRRKVGTKASLVQDKSNFFN